ncbi:hypothetical protein TVAG_383950 [Trichomonas vaginalis G3]|uniref:Uncharacterized protein n=1 Tax=Trichomonas vaginalis (strain ATCC PRA-98 / G3) TaxID=412133 RepID=A2F094_TRIV3|nr:hypothetical protein TVAGG3_0481090 [Trichomonas vaginalis G3]EAY01656.1 hypothetical protein TVAG_383950 [Trichomonas vaginalis G3]KAI5515713.1 hypothetical protein TVAGG3_0481090 [Trichomonas vaginalis G3]|eukprot:XP_001314249.1 hypothetical protein [Trichomonas vaginalis G3]
MDQYQNPMLTPEQNRISFERRLDMEKAQVIYDKCRNYVHFEHIRDSQIITMKLPPLVAEIVSISTGGTKFSIGCEQLGRFNIGQKKFTYSVNYSIGGRYGDTKFKINEPISDIDDKDLFDAIYDVIDPHRKLRAYKYLNMALPQPRGPDNYVSPFDIPEFRCDLCQQLLLYKEEIPKITKFTECKLRVDLPIAIYLVECFATNQSKKEKALTNKDFLTERKIYTLMLFADLPVLFYYNGKQVELTFAEYCKIPAQTIRNQLDFAMNIFKHCEKMICTFNEVLNYNFKQAHTIDAENDTDIAIVKEMDQPLYPSKNRMFMLFGLQSEPGKEQRAKYESTLREMWNKICIYICPVCQKLSTSRNPCPIGQHVGAQIPFEDGSMERDAVVAGFPTKQRIYECCGLVNVAFDYGCSTETHHSFPTDPLYFVSQLLFNYCY